MPVAARLPICVVFDEWSDDSEGVDEDECKLGKCLASVEAEKVKKSFVNFSVSSFNLAKIKESEWCVPS